MSTDAREALRRLVAALEEHLEAVAMRRGPDDAAVDDAYDAVAGAFEQYEEALDTEYAETVPLVLDDDFDDDDQQDGDDEQLDPHAEEDEDERDDDIEDFDLR